VTKLAAPPVDPVHGTADRIQAIDVARGAAMLMVFLSHFSLHYLYSVAGPRWFTAQALVTHIATPAFVLVSGIMLGLLRASRRDFTRMRDKLIDRGLFLLIVGRPFIALAHVALEDDWRQPFVDQVFITDTLGVCLILGSVIATTVGDRGRLRLGLTILVSSWVLDVLWLPDNWGGSLVKELLFGRLRGESLLYNFPLLPWFGWYLAGSGLGSIVARAQTVGGGKVAARGMFRAAAISLGIAVAARLAALPLKLATHAVGTATVAGRAARLLALGQKLPPGITFLFFYGAVALLGVGAVLEWGERVPTEDTPVAWRGLAMLGRNSLLAFVMQFYVYYTAVHLLPKPPLWMAPLYFAAVSALLLGAVALCDRFRLNRMFTVGYARWAARRRATRLAIAAPAPMLAAMPRINGPRTPSGHDAVNEHRR